MTFPEDADGDAMRRVVEDGSDPNQPMDIDFMISAPSVDAAKRMISEVEALGYSTSLSTDGEDVTLYCMRNMMLDYFELIDAQKELHRIASSRSGFIDGWGTSGNVSIMLGN